MVGCDLMHPWVKRCRLRSSPFPLGSRPAGVAHAKVTAVGIEAFP